MTYRTLLTDLLQRAINATTRYIATYSQVVYMITNRYIPTALLYQNKLLNLLLILSKKSTLNSFF